jgi:glycosyltransferase involved in cell wall biosynthesis
MKQKNPKVSVIIPIYNVEKYLPQCLESVINQTYKNLEIICVIDGVTDGSEKVLRGYAKSDKRIKIIVNKKNVGQSVCRNQGIDVATGEYIQFIDSDDYINLEFIEKMVAAAMALNADAAVSGFITTNNAFNIKISEMNILVSTDEKFRVSQSGKYAYIWRYLFRRDFLIKNKFRFKPGVIFEDVIWLPQVVLAANKIVTVPGAIYTYVRYNTGSTTKSKNRADAARRHKMRKDAYVVRNKFFAKNGISESYISYVNIITKIKLFGITIAKILDTDDKKYFCIFGVKIFKTIRRTI